MVVGGEYVKTPRNVSCAGHVEENERKVHTPSSKGGRESANPKKGRGHEAPKKKPGNGNGLV